MRTDCAEFNHTDRKDEYEVIISENVKYSDSFPFKNKLLIPKKSLHLLQRVIIDRSTVYVIGQIRSDKFYI